MSSDGDAQRRHGTKKKLSSPEADALRDSRPSHRYHTYSETLSSIAVNVGGADVYMGLCGACDLLGFFYPQYMVPCADGREIDYGTIQVPYLKIDAGCVLLSVNRRLLRGQVARDGRHPECIPTIIAFFLFSVN